MQAEAPPSLNKHPYFSLAICLTLCLLVGFVGAQASMSGLQGWYQALNKPAFNPPAWLFGPVWTTLYILMGIAVWQIWRSEPSRSRTLALALFATQLLLNGAWSWIFFVFRNLPFSFIEIVVLDVAILATILVFNRVRASAAWLLVPYLAWSLFATLLDYGIWKLNPTDPSPSNETIRISSDLPEMEPTPSGQ